MSDPFVGEIRMNAFNFAPRGWATCSGQLLAIAQNQALFSLLGTMYGGNGQTTFALPDLRGRVPVHAGQNSQSFESIQQGDRAGVEAVALGQSHLPLHTHGVRASTDLASGPNPAGAVMGAKVRGGVDVYGPASSPPAVLAPGAIANAGGGQAHNNMQPSLVVNFCIALVGIFPSRN